MKTPIALMLWVAWAPVGSAQQVLAEYDWRSLADSGGLRSGTPVMVDGKTALRLVNTNETPWQAQLLRIKQPRISRTLYAITGEVKYEGVRGAGYLEMWNYFPPATPGAPEAAYFSRTLGISGLMGKISGSSDWREFRLPFNWTGSSNAPIRLEVNLFLPGPGTVYLSALKLVEYSGAAGAAPSNAWWSDRMARYIGGIGGTVIGVLGAVLGGLAGRGKGRTFVLGTLWGLTGLGGLLGLAGVIALALRQPYAVWFVLTLGAVLLLFIPPICQRRYKRQYEELELRRMASADL